MDPRMDPEMPAFNRMMEERAAALPPIRLALPFDTPRALTEALNVPLSEGGPVWPRAATAGCRCAAAASSAGCTGRAGPGPHPGAALYPWRRLGLEQHRHP